jgi:PAS fold
MSGDYVLWGVPNLGLITFETLSARIHPEDLDRVRAAFTATRDIRGSYETDFRILHEDKIRSISARGKATIKASSVGSCTACLLM